MASAAPGESRVAPFQPSFILKAALLMVMFICCNKSTVIRTGDVASKLTRHPSLNTESGTSFKTDGVV